MPMPTTEVIDEGLNGLFKTGTPIKGDRRLYYGHKTKHCAWVANQGFTPSLNFKVKGFAL